MSRISTAFKDKKHKALVAYITAGYPDVEATVESALLLANSGCDIIELGIPFSDPMADGLTIQHSSHLALLNGVTSRTCFEIAGRIRSKSDVPLVFMTYLNPIISYGVEKFCADCSTTGIDGLIIPDLPPGELPALDANAKKHGVDIIYFVAPNSSPERIRMVAQSSSGFIYVVSVTGVTGVRNSFTSGLGAVISNVRKVTAIPLCIGFGISGPQQAAEAAALADGVIIGSRIIQIMEKEGPPYRELSEFIGQIRKSIDGAGV
jgi:tryptophan synthase alpha chain